MLRFGGVDEDAWSEKRTKARSFKSADLRDEEMGCCDRWAKPWFVSFSHFACTTMECEPCRAIPEKSDNSLLRDSFHSLETVARLLSRCGTAKARFPFRWNGGRVREHFGHVGQFLLTIFTKANA